MLERMRLTLKKKALMLVYQASQQGSRVYGNMTTGQPSVEHRLPVLILNVKRLNSSQYEEYYGARMAPDLIYT
jgi:hypothetical protein